MPRRVASAAVLHVFVAGLASGALAQAHVDVAVQENATDGRLSVHGYDFDEPAASAIVVDKRVFGRSLSSGALFTDDPGFVSRNSSTELDPAGLLPVLAGEPLRFNVLAAPSILPELGGRNLSYWDGTGPVVWSAVPDTEFLSIFTGPFANPDDEIFVDGSTTDVPGFVIGGTSGSGSLHEHIKFLLLPDGLAAPPVGPDDGVYLVLVELGYPAYAEWIPTWLLFQADRAEVGGVPLDLAVADVAANFQLPLCGDGIDNDLDGKVDSQDLGCSSPADMSERGDHVCDDGLDNDGDGRIDFDPVTEASPGDDMTLRAGAGDPTCADATHFTEMVACSNGIDDDSNSGIDHDGGLSLDLDQDGFIDAAFNPAEPAVTVPDPNCSRPWRTSELPPGGGFKCGLGFELVFLLAPLAYARRRRSGSDGPRRWKSRHRASS